MSELTDKVSAEKVAQLQAELRVSDLEVQVLQAQARLGRVAGAARCYICGSQIGGERWVLVQHGEDTEIEHASCHVASIDSEEDEEAPIEVPWEEVTEETEPEAELDESVEGFTFPAILRPRAPEARDAGRQAAQGSGQDGGVPIPQGGQRHIHNQYDDDGARSGEAESGSGRDISSSVPHLTEAA
jgi:hypothetical protein